MLRFRPFSYKIAFLTRCIASGYTGWGFWARKNSWSKRIWPAQGCCDRRHCWRPAQGHIWAVVEHSYQAHGRRVSRFCSFLCCTWRSALQDLLENRKFHPFLTSHQKFLKLVKVEVCSEIFTYSGRRLLYGRRCWSWNIWNSSGNLLHVPFSVQHFLSGTIMLRNFVGIGKSW